MRTTPDIRRCFAKRVRYLRAQRQWTQETLAERAGLTAKYIGRIERAEVCPSLRVLEQLAGAFEMPIHELLNLPEPGSRSRESMHYQMSTDELKLLRRALSILQRLLA